MAEENKAKPISNFRDLMIWKAGKDLVVDIYRITKAFPQEERFGLTDQMRRAAVSIPSNISEGFNRKYSNDYKRFLFTALGSCGELDTQLEIALALQMVDNDTVQKVADKINHESRMIRKLLEKIESSIAERKAAFKKTSPEARVPVGGHPPSDLREKERVPLARQTLGGSPAQTPSDLREKRGAPSPLQY